MYSLLQQLAPYKVWMILGPLQLAWLSIPFWLAAARTRNLRRLAEQHGLLFDMRNLPPDFPFQMLFPDATQSDARNILSGVHNGEPIIAFDLGSPYSRSQRPQTIVGRRRHAQTPPRQPPPNLYTLREAGGWTLVIPTRNAAERVILGVTSPNRIEQLWTALA